MTLTDQLAAAPISWGICEVPGWGAQLPVERVLSEMHELGFSATELGSPGYLPDDPGELTDVLAGYNLSLIGAFIPVVAHTEHDRARSREVVDEAASLLVATGAPYFITSCVTTWDWDPRTTYSVDDYARMHEFLDEIEAICNDRGLQQAVHPHIGTVIEQADEVQGVLDNSIAGFTLDTGHLLIGGYDPLDFATNYYDRIRHVHLKDVVMTEALPVVQGERSIMDGVQRGMFCNIGSGDVAMTEIVDVMTSRGFEGWYVIEQDAAITGDFPPAGSGPVTDIAASVEFLAGLGS